MFVCVCVCVHEREKSVYKESREAGRLNQRMGGGKEARKGGEEAGEEVRMLFLREAG